MKYTAFKIYIYTCLTTLILSCNDFLNETDSKKRSLENCIDDKNIKKHKTYLSSKKIKNKEINTSQKNKFIKKDIGDKCMKKN